MPDPASQTPRARRPEFAAGLRTAAAILLVLAILAAGTALIVRCAVALAEAPAEVFGNGR